MADSTIKHIATVFPIDAEALQPDPTFRRRRSIVRDFGLNTSTHGIPGIARSESIRNRLFWTISSMAFTGIMIYFITKSIQAYFNYPTQTSVSFIVDNSPDFPAVSICNYSPIRYDTFIGPFLNYTNARNLTNTNDTSMFTVQQAVYVRNFIQYLSNFNTHIDDYFFPLKSMLISCSYNGQTCTSDDFTQFLSATHGLCNTFNVKTKSNGSSVRKTTDYGDIGRLQLKLYVHSHQYVPYISDDVSAGMMAMVHDNTELPLIEIVGIQLEPGRRHKLSYKKRTYDSLPSPYSACTTEIPLVMQAMFNQYGDADYAYSPVLCNLLCVQTYIYQECHCVNPYQWTARSIVLPGTNTMVDAPLCDILDTCYNNATVEIFNSDTLWNQFCSNCSDSCSATDFTITPSAVAAPSASQIFLTKNFVEHSGIPTPSNWSQTYVSEIENNYIALDVICETSRIEAYSESASIGPVDLLSNIGGQTGLWIGMSFLSIMELVEMFYRLIRYYCYLLRRKKRDRERIADYYDERL